MTRFQKLCLFLFSALVCPFVQGCVSVNGSPMPWSSISEGASNFFSSATTKERKEFIAKNPGDPQAEMLRHDDTMIVGTAHHGVYFAASLDAVAEREKLVEESFKEPLGSPKRINLIQQIGAKSDQIVATERLGWQRKQTEITTAKTSAEQQAQALSNPALAQGDIDMLGRQLAFVEKRLEDLKLVPAAYADALFAVPPPNMPVVKTPPTK